MPLRAHDKRVYGPIARLSWRRKALSCPIENCCCSARRSAIPATDYYNLESDFEITDFLTWAETEMALFHGFEAKGSILDFLISN